jgi:hypothetical protein
MDDRRRKADADLVKAAETFAIYNGKLNEYRAELNFEPQYGDIEQEWRDIKSLTSPPARKRLSDVPLTQAEALDIKFKISFAGETSMHPLCLAPALSERHIGLDQGTRNFAIVCVDKRGNGLHSLNEVLCGSTNYRQLVPASSAISSNRTVVIAVLPHTIYWIALLCQFNLFTIEDMGTYESGLEGKYFQSAEVEKLIKDRLTVSLRNALTDFDASSTLEAVSDIKIIVKQLQGLNKYDLTRPQAGSLTQATYNAMKSLVERSSPAGS